MVLLHEIWHTRLVMLHRTQRPTPLQCDIVVLDQTHGSNSREKNGFEVQMVRSTHQISWYRHHRRELERDQIARIGNENRYFCPSFVWICLRFIVYGIALGLVWITVQIW